MKIINLIFGVPFGYMLYFCYQILSNYGVAVILFTFLTKIIVFPISLISQKNSIKMVKMQPFLDDIKERNQGNSDLILSEQRKLYKDEKYSVLKSVLPLLLQIPIILGVINVIYNPLQHLLHIDNQTIFALTQKATEVLGKSGLGSGAQLQVLEAIHTYPDMFVGVLGYDVVADRIANFNTMFLGIDLAQIPSLANFQSMLVPMLSGLSALLLCVVQNKYNVLQKEQGFLSRWGVSAFLVAFSTYFAFVVPNGVGVYWVAGNVFSVLVTMLCNVVYNPKKYIDYENRSQKPKLTKGEKQKLKERAKEEKALSKISSKKFYSVQNKQLVFYSEGSGFYKYFKGIIEYVTMHSDVVVHYVTSDKDDVVFSFDNPQIVPYFVTGSTLIPFMMKMDAEMVLMTMPDLENYHIKRSLVRDDIEYIFLDHGMDSFHLMFREGALDHYDTIFCYGPNHNAEVRETEKTYGLKKKKLINTGYVLLDELLDNVKAIDIEENEVKTILIAPSWQRDNILELCLDELLQPLLNKEYRIILRPHPEFVKRFPNKMNKIISEYRDSIGDMFIIETDFSSNKTVYSADVVITDWSSIAQEFSYATKKPSIFINTPMKIMNPNYKKIPLIPLDISIRDEIGVSIDVENLSTVYNVVSKLINDKDGYKEKIDSVVKENIYHIGESKRISGEYIINSLYEKQLIKQDKAQRNDVSLLGDGRSKAMKLYALGPVAMYDHTLEVTGKQLPYFRTPEFSKIMLESEQLLKKHLCADESSKIVFLTASGTGAMEATVMNCFTPKDKLLIIDGGLFGHRFVEISELHGVPYDTINLEFGDELTKEHLTPFEGEKYTALLVNIHETSTGQLYDVKLLADFCRRNEMYFIVDAISSFLADEFKMHELGADATILSSQKGLAISPGMAIVVLSDRLYNEKVLTTPKKTIYFDFKDHITNQLRGQTPFTPAVSVCLELNDMLRAIDEEGLENRLIHVQTVVDDFRERLKETELQIPKYNLSNACTPLVFPRKNANAVYEMLKNEYNIVLTPCGGDLKDILCRVGHLGNHNVEENKELIIALKEVLKKV